MKFTAITVALCICVSACQTIQKVDVTPRKNFIGKIDSSLLKRCNLPVAIPERPLTQSEVEHYWSIDRDSLIVCAKRHGFLADAIKFRDEQLNK